MIKKSLLVSRKKKPEDTVVNIKGELVGNGIPSFVFGPCAVESYEQVAAVAASIKAKGLKLFVVVHTNHVHHHMISKVLV